MIPNRDTRWLDEPPELIADRRARLRERQELPPLEPLEPPGAAWLWRGMLVAVAVAAAAAGWLIYSFVR